MNMERVVQYECKVCGRRIDVSRTGDVYEEPIYCCGVETLMIGAPGAAATSPALKTAKKKTAAKPAKKKTAAKPAKKKTAKKKAATRKPARKKAAAKPARKKAAKKKSAKKRR